MKRRLLVSALCAFALSAMAFPWPGRRTRRRVRNGNTWPFTKRSPSSTAWSTGCASGLTAFCPDKCGDSGEFANIAVKKYLKYQKLGEYGDPEQQSFQLQVSDFNKKPKGDPKVLQTVKGLKKGDYVLLSWRHDYVTKDGTSSRRPLVKLEK